MGLALSSLPRDSYTLSTKIGRYLRPHADASTWDSMGWAGGLQNSIEFAYSYDDVMRQYEDSVQRLGTGRIDCLVIHDIEEAEGQQPTHARGTRAFLAGGQPSGEKGGYKALEQLRKEGKIKAFGAGINIAVGTPNHTWETYRKWNVEYFDFLLGLAGDGEKKIDFILLAGNYTLLDLSAWEDGANPSFRPVTPLPHRLLCRHPRQVRRARRRGRRGRGVQFRDPGDGRGGGGQVQLRGRERGDHGPDAQARGGVRRVRRVAGGGGAAVLAGAPGRDDGHPGLQVRARGRALHRDHGEPAPEGRASPAACVRSPRVATLPAQNVDIPASFWSKLKEQKLLPDGVPTP